MKRLLFFAGVVLLCASFGWAQSADQNNSTTQPSTQSTTTNSTTARVGTVRGCVSGSDGNYMLTQDQSGTMFKLVGSDDQLKAHVGQEVLVTGQLADSSMTSPAGSAATTTGASSGGGMVQVTSVKMVSQTCTSGSNAAPPQQ
jgi:hypothetical protein